MICTFVKCERVRKQSTWKQIKSHLVQARGLRLYFRSPHAWTKSHCIAQRKKSSHTQYDHQREPVKQVEDIGAKFTYKSCVLSFKERIADPKKTVLIYISLVSRGISMTALAYYSCQINAHWAWQYAWFHGITSIYLYLNSSPWIHTKIWPQLIIMRWPMLCL